MAAPTPDTSAWLVETKLCPPLRRADTIPRPHLEEALRRSVTELPLTLLSAPAGYGKTTLLAALPHLLSKTPLAWVTLDAEDNDPVRFIGLLTTALQRLSPECGRSVWPWLAGGVSEVAGFKRAIGALVNDVTFHLPDLTVLILDDLHFVSEPAVYVALEYLLDHLPPHLHIAIGTRHDPPLRLARLAARRQLGELRRPDLGFSFAEAGQLLNDTLGLQLSPAEVTALQERTEGWPAGLCLLAGPLGRLVTSADRDQFMAAVTHTERYALDFLAEEVLRNLPADLRHFLLRTSVLAEMTPSLCQAVTGRPDAAEVLDDLYRQNLTIASLTGEADGEPVYRHHALFARLLTQQLARELPGEAVELHRRAAAAQKTPGRAIAHYLAAGLWDEAALAICQSGMQLLYGGLAETVRAWYNALPPDIVSRRPHLKVLMGRCEIHRGDYVAAALFLRQADQAFVAAGDAEGEAEAVTSLITLAYQANDRTAAAELVARAAHLPLKPWGQVGARLGRAWLRLPEGDWDALRTDLEQALAIPTATGIPAADLIGITYLNAPLIAAPGCLEVAERYAREASGRALPDTAWRLGADELAAWAALWRGRTGEALALAEGAEALRQRLGGYPFVGNDAPAQLAVLYLARGDSAAAAEAVDALLRRIEGAPAGKALFYLHSAGRSLALLGRGEETRATLRRLAALDDGSPLWRYLYAHLTGLLALVERRLPDAAASLEQAAALEATVPVAWVGGSARLLLARLQLDRGDAEAALATAAPALRSWKQAGSPGRALLDGPVVLPVLRLAAQRELPGAAAALQSFTALAPSETRPAPAAPAAAQAAAALREPLTQRERDVLRLIVAGRTNREIGRELYITAETVKTHVVHILRKLDVTSRTQAALRGRELGF